MCSLPKDPVHYGVLNKFEHLKGEIFYGQENIKGKKGSGSFLAPDEFVPQEHILHDLIRGFYKPKGKSYMLSYQATESEKNYGKQIKWTDSSQQTFERILMPPPSKKGDTRAKSDIAAARYNLQHGIPIGIFHNIKKAVNQCLGLGVITDETTEGIFIVKPFSLNQETQRQKVETQKKIMDLSHITETEKETIIKYRVGHGQFKENLLAHDPQCKICGIDLKGLLIASHIKPWKDSNSIERLEFGNGFLFCPNHDALFDKGFISFGDDGEILVSSVLDKNTLIQLGLTHDLKITLLETNKKYLKWHRENQFTK